MTSTTNTISRLTRALVLAVALAAFTAPVALGNHADRPKPAQSEQVEAPDWFERAAARSSQAETPDWFERAAARGSQAETPDWFERAAARSSRAEAPDWFERAAARHSDAIAGDKRSPHAIDAALLAQSRGSSVTQLDLMSPDTRDAALRVPTQVIASESGNAFDWGDFGLGFAASSGVLLLVLLGAGILAVRGHRGGHITST